jgi:hypothetical protein
VYESTRRLHDYEVGPTRYFMDRTMVIGVPVTGLGYIHFILEINGTYDWSMKRVMNYL